MFHNMLLSAFLRRRRFTYRHHFQPFTRTLRLQKFASTAKGHPTHDRWILCLQNQHHISIAHHQTQETLSHLVSTNLTRGMLELLFHAPTSISLLIQEISLELLSRAWITKNLRVQGTLFRVPVDPCMALHGCPVCMVHQRNPPQELLHD